MKNKGIWKTEENAIYMYVSPDQEIRRGMHGASWDPPRQQSPSKGYEWAGNDVATQEIKEWKCDANND